MTNELEIVDVEYQHGPGPTLVGDTATEVGRIRFELNRSLTPDEHELLIPQRVLAVGQSAWVYIEPGMDVVDETKRARDAIDGTAGVLQARAAQEQVLREAMEVVASTDQAIDTETTLRLREELDLD